MTTLRHGQEFTDVDPDEFGRINKAANAVRLMALVDAVREDDDGDKLISFRLTHMDDA